MVDKRGTIMIEKESKYKQWRHSPFEKGVGGIDHGDKINNGKVKL